MIKEKHSVVALRALEKAVRQARQTAAEKKLKVPVWEKGKIIYQDPREDLQQDVFLIPTLSPFRASSSE